MKRHGNQRVEGNREKDGRGDLVGDCAQLGLKENNRAY